MKKLLFLALAGALISCENKPPTCEIIEPVNDTVYFVNDTINIKVEAEDPDGVITEVRVSVDGKGIASLKDWPYEYVIYPGNYSHTNHRLEVVAYDEERLEASDEVNFEIGALPSVETTEPTEIKTKHAVVGGRILSGTPPYVRGVYYGEETDPEKSGTLRQSMDDLTIFSVKLANLEPNTRYYYCAFLSNKFDTVVGQTMTFKTEQVFIPTVSTTPARNVTYTSARSGGTIDDDGNDDILAKGVCWSTSVQPDINDSKTDEGDGDLPFISDITELEPGTTYYLRAYARNEVGTGYGEQVTFTTLAYEKPTVSTLEVTDITENSALCGGNVTDDGGQEITERGICWSSSMDPGLDDSVRYDPVPGIGQFTIELSSLESGKEYHVRAFARSEAGISYGEDVIFRTNGLATVSTSVPFTISQTHAQMGGTVIYDGGSEITDRGIYYSESPDPAGSGAKVQAGTGTGLFQTEVGALAIGQTYYVVAYAENAYGTSYGDVLEYTHIDEDELIQDVDGNYYRIVQIGSQWWMAENLATTSYNDGSAIPNITDKATWQADDIGAYCWYNNDYVSYGQEYGALYNYKAVATGMLCPNGWHVPSDSEWKVLEGYLGMSSSEQERYNDFRGTDEGGKLKEAGTQHWEAPNTGATNESGFSALPGGARSGNAEFNGMNGNTFLWTSTPHTDDVSWYRSLSKSKSGIGRSGAFNYWGMYIRCIKD